MVVALNGAIFSPDGGEGEMGQQVYTRTGVDARQAIGAGGTCLWRGRDPADTTGVVVIEMKGGKFGLLP